MSLKQKFFNYFNNLLFSCAILWAILIVLSFNNLKPEIIIWFFLIFSLFLLFILYNRQIITSLLLNLNKLNYFLKSTDERLDIYILSTRKAIFLLIIQVFYLLKGFPRLLKYLFTNYYSWSVVTTLGILLDIFIFKFTSDLVILFLIGLWVILVRHYKFEGRISVGIALGFLILCPFLFLFKKELIAEKAAVWTYLFLVVGVGQMFVEYLREERKSGEKKEV